jgi:hypothetical protein
MKSIILLAIATIIHWSSQPVMAADTRSGGGIVYHRSDCGYPNVRFYGKGGEWDGSTCDKIWVNPVNWQTLNKFDFAIIHSFDFNFKAEELACFQAGGQAEGGISAPGMREFRFDRSRFDSCGIGFVYDSDSYPFMRNLGPNHTVEDLNEERKRWARWPQFNLPY